MAPPLLTDVELARIARALADPQRREILEIVAAAGELCCSTLVARFPVSQATISHHLKELLTAGLLVRRKDGQFGYYRFRADVMAAYLADAVDRFALAPAAPPRRRAGGR